MIKWTINYTDFNDVERTEEQWFGLSQTELTEINSSKSGGMEKALKRIIDAQDQKQLIEVFKEFILKAYGEKSEDGRSFIKERNGHRLADDFAQTAAYDALFMELATDDEKATKFITGIVPKALANQIPNNIKELPTA